MKKLTKRKIKELSPMISRVEYNGDIVTVFIDISISKNRAIRDSVLYASCKRSLDKRDGVIELLTENGYVQTMQENGPDIIDKKWVTFFRHKLDMDKS